jgi:hypothetical protein
MFPRCAPITFYPTESAFIPWKQKIHTPPTKRLTFTLGDARIEVSQYVLCMHKGLEIKMGNLYTDRTLPNENHSWVYTLKGTYKTWDDLFRHAYKLAVKHQIINEEHLMNITHDNAQENPQNQYGGYENALRLYNNALERLLLGERFNMNTTYDKDTEAYFQAHPHHVQLLKDMEQTEKETKEIVRQIVEEIKAIKAEVKERFAFKAIKAEVKEKAKSTQTPLHIETSPNKYFTSIVEEHFKKGIQEMKTQTPFPTIPTFADKKSLHQVSSKETFAHWNIRVYATEKTHTLRTDYYVLLKHVNAKHKNWISKKDGGFPSYEEAYYAAILWITHMQGYETIAINDMKIQSAYPSKTS